MAKRNKFYVPTEKKLPTETVELPGGGTATLTQTANGGFEGEVVRGYRETPQERKVRLETMPKANVLTPKNKKARGGRQGAKREALRSF